MKKQLTIISNFVSPGVRHRNHILCFFGLNDALIRGKIPDRPREPFASALLTIQKKMACLRASMTVEAALILPFFLFVVMNLLSITEMYRCHAAVTASLWKSGRQMALYGYLYDKLELDEYALDLNSVTISESYVRMNLGSDLEQNGSGRVVLGTGTERISLIRSKLMTEKDRICLHADLLMTPPCSLYPGQAVIASAVYTGHAWNGYKVSGYVLSEYEETIVYVTETGTVYHKKRDCPYLNPAITMVEASRVGEERNDSGGIYHPCETCRPRGGDTYYITKYGTVYHGSLQCPALKRTVYAVKLSEVGDKMPCSKCGGGH